jgi:serine/threonine protein kinase
MAAIEQKETSFEPGQFVRGYRLIEFLGAGGFGEAWLAQSPHGGERVALKMARPERPGAAEALRREAEIFERLRWDKQWQDPPLILLHQAFLDEEDGPPALVLEYAAGGNLRQWMKKRQGQPVPWQHTLRMIQSIVIALDWAHERGVIHRDLSPENILFDPKTDRWKVADFGAGTMEEAIREERVSFERSGGKSTVLAPGIAGKLDYMAPEVRRGEEATYRADFYALGVIWVQLLVGDMDAGLPALWMRQVPPHLLPSLETCLETHPSQRWPAAGKLSLEITRASLGLVQRAEIQQPIAQIHEELASNNFKNNSFDEFWFWVMTSLMLFIFLYYIFCRVMINARAAAEVSQFLAIAVLVVGVLMYLILNPIIRAHLPPIPQTPEPPAPPAPSEASHGPR